MLHFSKGEKQRYQTLKGLLGYILFVFVWHRDSSGQSPQVNLLIMSNTRYNHAVEPIHCSHHMQCKAGTGSSGWLGKVQCRLQQAGFLFSPKSCQRYVDSGLFLCYDALMDTLFSGSVKSIARFIHLDFTGLPPTKMSQTPEIHLRSAALTFGWALV